VPITAIAYRRLPCEGQNSTAVTTIPAAQKTKNLTIYENSQVTRIISDDKGKITGVQYLREDRNISSRLKLCCFRPTHTRTFACCCFRNRKAYPNGLVNNHGQVGKNYIGHWANREVTRSSLD